MNKRIRNSSATSAERQATTALDVLAKSSLPSLLAQACPTDDLPYVAKIFTNNNIRKFCEYDCVCEPFCLHVHVIIHTLCHTGRTTGDACALTKSCFRDRCSGTQLSLQSNRYLTKGHFVCSISETCSFYRVLCIFKWRSFSVTVDKL